MSDETKQNSGNSQSPKAKSSANPFRTGMATPKAANQQAPRAMTPSVNQEGASTSEQAPEIDEQGFPQDPLQGLTEEERIQQFVLGNITLSQLQNISREQIYSLAEIGNNFFKQGQHEKARAIFEGLVVMDPIDPWLHLCLGLCFAHLGNDTRAVQELDRTIFLNEFNIQARLERAEILMKYGEIEPAVEDLAKAIELDQKGEDPYALRARILLDALKSMVDSKAAPASTPET